MMQLIERNKIFTDYKSIHSLIHQFQLPFFDESEDVIKDEIFDALGFDFQEIKRASFDLMIKHIDINTYSRKLSDSLKELLNYLNCKNLIILSHLKIDFFSQIEFHDFEKVVDSFKKLSQLINSHSYKEAILINLKEFNSFIEIFFWFEICNASPEYVFWFDKEQRFCFYLCKYGNIHIIDFTDGNLISENELLKLGFIVNEDYFQF